MNSSGLIRLQVSPPRPQARAGHALPEARGHGHGVTLSFWCHATCQSLSTELRGQHLPASHTPATNSAEEAELQAVAADEVEKYKLSGGTVNFSPTYQVTTPKIRQCLRSGFTSYLWWPRTQALFLCAPPQKCNMLELQQLRRYQEELRLVNLDCLYFLPRSNQIHLVSFLPCFATRHNEKMSLWESKCNVTYLNKTKTQH